MIDDKTAQYLGYHNHNYYCDGKGFLEDYVKEAVIQGFKHLGFSSHAPFFFSNKWSIKTENINKYIGEIENLNSRYGHSITLFKALEIDYLPGKIEGFSFFKNTYKLDYTIGSIHYIKHPESEELLFIDGPEQAFRQNVERLFAGDIRQVVELYFERTREMIRQEQADIIGHIDKLIKNSASLICDHKGEYPLWYRQELLSTLETAARHQSIIELNLRGLILGNYHTFFPDERFIAPALDMGLRFVISADAHHPSEIGRYYDEAFRRYRKAGGKKLVARQHNVWTEYEL